MNLTWISISLTSWRSDKKRRRESKNVFSGVEWSKRCGEGKNILIYIYIYIYIYIFLFLSFFKIFCLRYSIATHFGIDARRWRRRWMTKKIAECHHVYIINRPEFYTLCILPHLLCAFLLPTPTTFHPLQWVFPAPRAPLYLHGLDPNIPISVVCPRW